MNTRNLLAEKAKKEDEMRALHVNAENENRDLTADEMTRWNSLSDEVASLGRRAERSSAVPEAIKPEGKAPAYIRKLGDSEDRAISEYLRTGDSGAVRDLLVETNNGEGIQIRASNATDMNIGTAADGGDLVPTGFYNQIIAKRTEASLVNKLGIRSIPGKGTTVDIPYDNEADGEFVSTAEAATYDLDAPAVAKRQATLVTYTKYIQLSKQVLRDEDASLLPFLADWWGRGQAKTMNSLLLTEVATTGTAYKTTAASTAIVLGEMEDTALNDTLGDYLDDTPSVSWVMRPSTYAYINKISGNPKLYAPAPGGSGIAGRELLGYPVNFSNKAAAIASTAKVAYFGNWNFVGMREGEGFTILRDPYSLAKFGQVVLWLSFDCVFKQLQADAVGYMKMKT